MTAAEKATALLDNLTLFEVNQLSPDKRRQFAALCQIWSWQLEDRGALSQRHAAFITKLQPPSSADRVADGPADQ